MEQETDSQAMDAVLRELGWYGRYQVFQLFQQLLCVFPLAFHILSVVFIGKANGHKCKKVSNTSNYWFRDVSNVTYNKCSVTFKNESGEDSTMSCPDGLLFEEPEENSMISEWGLVCENEALADISQTVLMAGMIAGAFIFTSLADKYGRKPFHVGCHLGLLATGLASAFVPNFIAFLTLRFLLGALQQGTGLTSGILSMEILPAERRSIASYFGAFLWALGMVILAAIALLMNDLPWRYLQMTLMAFSLYSVLQIWYTDESLRWLAANGKVQKAESILKRAAAMNHVDEGQVLATFRTKVLKNIDKGKCVNINNPSVNGGEELLPQNKTENDLDDASLPKYNFLDFFRNRHVFLCTVINAFMWIVDAMTYYGLSMTSVTLAENMYIGFLLSALAELPSVFAFAFFIDRIGRKHCCVIFHALAGSCLLISVVLSSVGGDSQAVKITIIALALCGKFAISMTFSVIFLYTPELFPTNLRNASLGMGSMAGRVGGMIAPYSRTLAQHIPWAPGAIFGSSCILITLLIRLLPETSGRELPQTIEEMTLRYKDKKKIQKRITLH